MKFARKNQTLDTICEVVGFTATTTLIEWYGGANLCVPVKVDQNHFLSKAMGHTTFAKLVDAFGGQTIWVSHNPTGRYANADANMRKVARLLAAGRGARDIAHETGLSQRQVQRIRLGLEEQGIRPQVLPG